MFKDLYLILGLMAHYFFLCFLIPVSIKKMTCLDHEWPRKIQHIGFGLTVFWIVRFSHWWVAFFSFFIVFFVGIVFLILLEYLGLEEKILIPRKGEKGELRRQLLYALTMESLLVLWFWGLLGETYRFFIILSVMPWMFGDAFAALIGKRWGVKAVLWPFLDGNKTYLGTLAMFLTSGACLYSLSFYYTADWIFALVATFCITPVITYVELASKKGRDTLNVPLTTAFLISVIYYLMM